jgi:hypothetical protein
MPITRGLVLLPAVLALAQVAHLARIPNWPSSTEAVTPPHSFSLMAKKDLIALQSLASISM